MHESFNDEKGAGSAAAIAIVQIPCFFFPISVVSRTRSNGTVVLVLGMIVSIYCVVYVSVVFHFSPCKKGVPVTLRGPSGREVFTIDRGLVRSALEEISKAALPHKISTQPSQSVMVMQPPAYPVSNQPPAHPKSSRRAERQKPNDDTVF